MIPLAFQFYNRALLALHLLKRLWLPCGWPFCFVVRNCLLRPVFPAEHSIQLIFCRWRADWACLGFSIRPGYFFPALVFFVFRVLPRRKVGLFGSGLIMFNGIKYRFGFINCSILQNQGSFVMSFFLFTLAFYLI